MSPLKLRQIERDYRAKQEQENAKAKSVSPEVSEAPANENRDGQVQSGGAALGEQEGAKGSEPQAGDSD